jgi:hypothetical protein
VFAKLQVLCSRGYPFARAWVLAYVCVRRCHRAVTMHVAVLVVFVVLVGVLWLWSLCL